MSSDAAAVVVERLWRDKRRVLEMLQMQVDMSPHGGAVVVVSCRPPGMTFAPHAEGAHVDERHLGIAVVATRRLGQELVEPVETDRVVVIRFDTSPVFDDFARVESNTLRPGVEHPFGRCILGRRFADAES